MQFLVLYVPERLSADVASILWLVMNKNMLGNVRPLTAPIYTFFNSESMNNFLTANQHNIPGRQLSTMKCT